MARVPASDGLIGRIRPWIGLPVVAAAAGLGGVHPPVRLVLIVLAVACGGAAAWRWRRPRGAGRVALWLASAVLAVAAVALVPVPQGIREIVQPGLADRIGGSLALVDRTVHPLAVHPAAAWSGWGMAAASWVLALGARAASRRDEGRGAARGVVAAGLVTAGWAAVQRIFGWDAVLPVGGIGAGEEVFGPFVYANHAAALLAAGAAWSGALALGRRRGRGLPWFVAALALSVATVATGSRGGLVLLLVGASGVLALVRHRWARPVLGVLLVGGLGGGGVALLGTGGIGRAITGRPDLWADAVAVIRAAPVLGVGVGGYGDAWWALRLGTGFGTARHAHSEPLQALAELGIVPAAVLAVAFGIAGVAGIRRALTVRDGRWRRSLGGALAACAVLAVGGLWDFPLRSGAVALAAAAAFGTVLGLCEARPGGAAARPVGVWALGAAALGAGAVGWGLATDEDAVRAAVDAGAATEADVAVLVARRPLWDDALVLLARVRFDAGDVAGALAALEQARIVAPNALDAWLATARLHRARGDLPAAREAYRRFLALDLPWKQEMPYIREALSAVADPASDWERVIPERIDRRCQAAAALVALGHAEEAEAIWARAAPLDSRCAAAFANHLVRTRRPAEALEVARHIAPGCGADRVTGLAHVALGNHAEGLRHLDEALRACAVKDVWLRAGIGTARVALGDDAGVAVLEKVVAERPDLVAPKRALLDAYVARSRWTEALPLLEEAYLEGWATDDDLVRYAELTRRFGSR